jgi:hypothetical protein
MFPINVFTEGLFYGTRAKSDLVLGNRRFLDNEEKATCRHLDRSDKLGLPALLRGAADYIVANRRPASTDEKLPSVGQHWVRRFLERHPEYTLKSPESPKSGANPTRTCKTGFDCFKT